MSRFSSLGRLAIRSSALASSLTAPALAQDEATPEEYRSIDEHGVDLVSGSYNITIPEGGIGPADGGIAMVRHYGRSGYLDNWSGDLRVVNEGGQLYAIITYGAVSAQRRDVGVRARYWRKTC